MTSATDHLQPLLAKLTLEEKVSLVQGADFWTTVPLPSIGLRAMTLSDGPAGVRGPRWDEREPSLNLPSGSALGASWDVDLAYRYGAAAASEARRKDVDVVLGPTINLHRSPLGGRHFECFSEDPELSAELAAAYVGGLQDNGVAATPKHYVANDSETDRFTVDVQLHRARAARAVPRPVRAGGGCRSLGADERLQRGRRCHDDRERPARGPAELGVGLRRRRRSRTGPRCAASTPSRPRRTSRCPAPRRRGRNWSTPCATVA